MPVLVIHLWTKLYSQLNDFYCRALQDEYNRLKGTNPHDIIENGSHSSADSGRDAELLAEAKVLRQHKGRLEARMQILEDHNRQLESQLQRLRQLLEQVREIFFYNAEKYKFLF